MAEAVVNVVVEQLISATAEWLTEEISLISGVKEELENMSIKMQTIQKVLDDAENKSMKEATVKLWLEMLQDISYDMEDVLDEWNTRVLIQKDKQAAEDHPSNQITSSSSSNKCTCLSFKKKLNCFSSVKQIGWRRDIAWRIKDINKRINFIFSEMDKLSLISKMVGNDVFAETIYNINSDRITTSLVVESEVHGRDDVKRLLLSKVLSEGSEQLDSMQVISIVGVGGLGKTTLAQLVFNDSEVNAKFQKKLWISVSDSFDEVKVALGILEGMGVNHNKTDLQNLHGLIKKSLANRKFLLVLDDVWDEKFEKWRRLRICLQDGGRGSTVLVTTRKELVAIGMGTTPTNMIKPNLISDSDCWSLMSQIAFQGKHKDECKKLEGIGQEIAKKCNGLPLAARTLGGILLSKSTEEEWAKVLESEFWELENVELELFPHLFLSYRELPPTLKRCFSYLAMFPKDSLIVEDELILLWMAQGYLKPKRSKDDMMQIGQEYLKCLISRALFEENIKDRMGRCYASMHDIMHDFALHLVGHEFLSIAQENDNSTSSDLTSAKRSYPKSTKGRHVCMNGSMNPIAICDAGKLRSCLVTGLPQNVTVDLVKQLKVVRALHLRSCNMEQVPQDIGKLIHLRMLDLSDNPFHELPDVIGDLYNLQCLWLLELDNLSSLPSSIGRLINLQNLRGAYYGTGSCNLGLMKNLNQLGGDLVIDFVNDCTDEVDAKEADLKRKLCIRKLVFNFKDHEVTGEVFEALQAPPSLQCLKITGFMGARLPSWITSLKYLTKLEVYGSQVLSLPPLGHLQSLKELQFETLLFLQSITREFLGINNTNRKFCAFPKLTKLRIYGCYQLKEWEDLKPEDENIVTVMPKLEMLHISDCRRLKVPRRLILKLSSLKDFCIDNCEPILDSEELKDGVNGAPQPYPDLQCMWIDDYRGTKFPSWILSLNFLTNLTVHGAYNILSLPPFGILPSLKELHIRQFKAVTFIGREFLGIGDNKKKDNFAAFPRLVKLELNYFDELKEWEDIKPEDEHITVMPKLKVLEIGSCSKLQVFPRRLLCKAASLEELNFNYNGSLATESLKNDEELLLHIKKVYVDLTLLRSKRV